jgi:hypothetical protein
LASAVLGWGFKAFMDWEKRSFWIGFTEGSKLTRELGHRPTTPEEKATLRARIDARLKEELEKIGIE